MVSFSSSVILNTFSEGFIFLAAQSSLAGLIPLANTLHSSGERMSRKICCSFLFLDLYLPLRNLSHADDLMQNPQFVDVILNSSSFSLSLLVLPCFSQCPGCPGDALSRQVAHHPASLLSFFVFMVTLASMLSFQYFDFLNTWNYKMFLYHFLLFKVILEACTETLSLSSDKHCCWAFSCVTSIEASWFFSISFINPRPHLTSSEGAWSLFPCHALVFFVCVCPPSF